MILSFEHTKSGVLNNRDKALIESEVAGALGAITTINNQFVVNDRIWWKRGTKKNSADLKPVVVNEAEYITKGIEARLCDLDWETQKLIEIDGDQEMAQKFDAFKEFTLVGGYCISDDASHKKILERCLGLNPIKEFAQIAAQLQYMYRSRGCFQILAHLSSSIDCFAGAYNVKLRVGLEIETGNIASSFRSIHKLNALYLDGKIDYGVLITSETHEDGAAAIWPRSNRNGSLEELRRRNAFASVSLPLLLVGFRPDSFSRECLYLKDDGTLYSIESFKTEKVDGILYDVSQTHVHDKIYSKPLI